ncbi:MAG: hypothetical protein WC614_13245 [bacterium]
MGKPKACCGCDYAQKCDRQRNRFTKEEEINDIISSAKEMNKFYKCKILNNKESIEIIASALLGKFSKLNKVVDGVTIRDTFNANHDGKTASKDDFSEDLLGIALRNEERNFDFGKIFDYQVPFTKPPIIGPIDLVAVDGVIIKLIELKAPDSVETLLRCILEIYTYYKILIRAKKKFISEYEKDLPQEHEYSFHPLILVGEHSAAGEELSKIEDYHALKILIGKLEAELDEPFEFYVYNYDGDKMLKEGPRDNKDRDRGKRFLCGKFTARVINIFPEENGR